MGCLQQVLQVVYDTIVYLGSFLYFWVWQQPINKLEVFGEQRLPLCHVYMLAKTLQLWDAPHYRAASFAEDLRANLKNVAIPGTGIPLSVFCHSKLTALLFILLVNPTISLVAAIHSCYFSQQDHLQQQQQQQQQTQSAGSTNHNRQPASVAAAYRQFLLFPSHWFAIWRHNCLLVGYHALVTGSSSYRMEGKGTFLLEGQRLGLPVSPFYSDGTVFVKHVSVEGGMGIHVFRNFAQGGEWVIQRALSNSDSLSRMLPPGAPLSTLRVVTASTAWLDQQNSQHSRPYSNSSWLQQHQQQQQQQQQQAAADRYSDQLLTPTASSNSTQSASRRVRRTSGVNTSSSSGSSSKDQVVGRVTPELPLSATVMQQQGRSPSMQHSSSNGHTAAGSQAAAACLAADSAPQQSSSDQLYGGQVQVVTAVWRAGLAGKDTDHSSICFPMDANTGVLSKGVSANHWYKLGLRWLGRIDGSTAGQTWQEHPDSGVTVAGTSIPDVQQIMHTVMQAHMVATPDVPVVGWDVALTPSGVYLLEMNLSCNMFNGNFTSDDYYHNMFRHLAALAAAESSWQQAHGERQK